MCLSDDGSSSSIGDSNEERSLYTIRQFFFRFYYFLVTAYISFLMQILFSFIQLLLLMAPFLFASIFAMPIQHVDTFFFICERLQFCDCHCNFSIDCKMKCVCDENVMMATNGTTAYATNFNFLFAIRECCSSFLLLLLLLLLLDYSCWCI